MSQNQSLRAPDIAVWNVHADEIMRRANPNFVCRGGVEDLFRERETQTDFINGLVRMMLTKSQNFAGGMIFSRDAYDGTSQEYWIEIWPREPAFVADGQEGIWRKLFGESDPRVKDCYNASSAISDHFIRLFQSDELERERDIPGYKAQDLPEPDYRHR